MESFGIFLKDRGVITDEQLEEATQSRVIFGGRLGTNLVELGYVKLADVGRHLSEYLEVPIAPKEWLEQPEPEAIEAVPKELAEKHVILPLHLEKRRLHLAMLSPRDPVQLDDICFATGLTVVPYIIPEVQMLAMLEHRYGIRREVRYINLGRDAARGQLGKSKVDSPAREPVAEPAVSHDLIDEESFAELHDKPSMFGADQQAAPEPDVAAPSAAPPPVAAPQAPAAPVAAAPVAAAPVATEPAAEAQPAVAEVSIDVADLERPDIVVPRRAVGVATLEAELVIARDRDAVSECTLRLARRYCEAAALFVVRGGVVSGYRGDGDVVSEQISGILLPIESDSDITGPAKSGRPFRGRPPSTGLDAKLLDSLGRSETAEVAVYAIQIRGQVVNLLYTDAGMTALGDTRFAALEVVAGLASSAYERLILAAKAHVQPS